MRKFKFFQKSVKRDLSMLGGEIFHTMSYDDNFHITGGVGDTPEDYYGMRRLYHTNPAQYEMQREIREELRTRLREGGFTEEERLRYRNDAQERMRDLNDNTIQSTLEPNPNWYQSLMKLKNWFNDMYGVIIDVAMVIITIILIIMVL